MWLGVKPMNMGSWYFVDRRIEQSLSAVSLKLARLFYWMGTLQHHRTGAYRFLHIKQQADLVDLALTTK
jgi:2-oxoglutarate dehydrogenase E1 component